MSPHGGRFLTLLHAPGRELRKTFHRRPDGTVAKRDYDNPTEFLTRVVPVADFAALRRELDALSMQPDTCLVRAAPGKWHPASGPVFRLLHPQDDWFNAPDGPNPVRRVKPAPAGDPTAMARQERDLAAGRLVPVTWLPMLEDVPSCVVALDFERVRYTGPGDWREAPAFAAEQVRQTLPMPCRDVTCWVQATASAANPTKPDLGGDEIRLRLAFLLDRPLRSGAVKRWLRGVPGLDPCTLNAVQIIYTAAPRFASGLVDPMPRRSFVLEGLDDEVTVPPEVQDEDADSWAFSPGSRRPLSPSAEGLGLLPSPGLERALARLSGEPGGVRQVLRAAAFAYVEDVGTEQVDESALAEALAAAAVPYRSGSEVRGYNLPQLVRWARSHVPDVEPDNGELTELEAAALAMAAVAERGVAEILTGQRTYDDPTALHFALAAGLVRGGCADPGLIRRVLVACDRRHGRPTHRLARPDYAGRTIAAALAAAERDREAVRHGRSVAEGLLA